MNYEDDYKSCIDPRWGAKIRIPDRSVKILKKQTEAFKSCEPGEKKYWLSTSMKWWSLLEKLLDKWYYGSSGIVHIVISKENYYTFVYIECIII